VYTVSARGFTLARPGMAAEFTTLQRWLAEAAAFARLRARPFFRGFSAWKRFRVWWRAVRLGKMAAARAQLDGSLVVQVAPPASGVLARRAGSADVARRARAWVARQGHRHMRALHELCWALRGLRLHRLERAQPPRLAAFCAGQAAALDAAGAALEGFGAAAAEVMAAACAEALQTLQTRLDLFAQRQARAHLRLERSRCSKGCVTLVPAVVPAPSTDTRPCVTKPLFCAFASVFKFSRCRRRISSTSAIQVTFTSSNSLNFVCSIALGVARRRRRPRSRRACSRWRARCWAARPPGRTQRSLCSRAAPRGAPSCAACASTCARRPCGPWTRSGRRAERALLHTAAGRACRAGV